MYKHFSGNVNLSVFKSWTPVVGYGYDKWFYIGRDSGNLFFLDFNYHNVFSILNIRICKKAILKYFRYTLLYVSSRYFALNLLNQSCVDQSYDIIVQVSGVALGPLDIRQCLSFVQISYNSLNITHVWITAFYLTLYCDESVGLCAF